MTTTALERPAVAEDRRRGELAGRPAQQAEDEQVVADLPGSPAGWLMIRSIPRRGRRLGGRAGTGRRPTRPGARTLADDDRHDQRREDRAETCGQPAVPADLRARRTRRRRRRAPPSTRKSVQLPLPERPSRRRRSSRPDERHRRDERDRRQPALVGREGIRGRRRGAGSVISLIRRGPPRGTGPATPVRTCSSYSARAWRSARVRWARCSSTAGSSGGTVSPGALPLAARDAVERARRRASRPPTRCRATGARRAAGSSRGRSRR